MKYKPFSDLNNDLMLACPDIKLTLLVIVRTGGYFAMMVWELRYSMPPVWNFYSFYDKCFSSHNLSLTLLSFVFPSLLLMSISFRALSFSVLTFLLHVEVAVSQGKPVSRQCGPLVLGETSPRFVDAKAATKLP